MLERRRDCNADTVLSEYVAAVNSLNRLLVSRDLSERRPTVALSAGLLLLAWSVIQLVLPKRVYPSNAGNARKKRGPVD